MRALTVKYPYSAAIAHGPKRIENRTKPIPYKHLGTTVLIHAGATEDRTPRPSDQMPRDLTDGMSTWPRHHRAIVAVALLGGCHKDEGCCRPWGFPNTWHWEIKNVHALPQPVHVERGQLGLWTVDDDVLTAVRRQVQLEVA
jgi:hypothetical protein